MNPRLSYQQAVAQGASRLRLVLVLYDQAIADLHSALSALVRGDIEGRTRMVNHALKVIGCLEATLNKNEGGEVAENLERFYRKLRAGILQAQFRQSEVRIRRQIADLIRVREAWEQVGQVEELEARQAPLHGENSGDAPPAITNWRV
jgi:flagellar secretion chaperone FliS